jgi:hypothetical protein
MYSFHEHIKYFLQKKYYSQYNMIILIMLVSYKHNLGTYIFTC